MLDKVYKWWHEKIEEAEKDDNKIRGDIKAFGLGMINGALSFMTVFGTIVYVYGIATMNKRK